MAKRRAAPPENINRSGGARKKVHRLRPMNENRPGTKVDAIENLDNSGDKQERNPARERHKDHPRARSRRRSRRSRRR